MKQPKIKSIEPVCNTGLAINVCCKEVDYREFTDPVPHVHTSRCVKKIRSGLSDHNKPLYGYNFKDELLFEVPAANMIVYYFTEDELKEAEQ